MTPDERRAKIEALLLEEREEAYALAWRRGLEAIDSHVRFTLATKRMSRRAESNAKTAIGMLCGAAEGDARRGVISSLCAETLIAAGRAAVSRLAKDHP